MDEGTVDTDELLALLSDDHARDILDTLGEEALSARALIDRLDVSRATVYRRLNRLEEASVVETQMTFDPEGHHRKQYRVTIDELQLSFEEDGLTVAAAV